MNTWISTKERLPELDEAVLVFLKPFEDISFAWREKSYSTDYEETWVTNSGVMYRDELISHWMPLPENPKE